MPESVADTSEVINEIDPQTTVICDTGMVMNFAPAFFQSNNPYFTTCNGQFCQMDSSPPAVIGCKSGRPDHPVVAFCGDQSFIHRECLWLPPRKYWFPA